MNTVSIKIEKEKIKEAVEEPPSKLFTIVSKFLEGWIRMMIQGIAV